MASSSAGWSAEESASRPAIRVDSGKNFAMEPLETDEVDEVTSPFGKNDDLLISSCLLHPLF